MNDLCDVLALLIPEVHFSAFSPLPNLASVTSDSPALRFFRVNRRADRVDGGDQRGAADAEERGAAAGGARGHEAGEGGPYGDGHRRRDLLAAGTVSYDVLLLFTHTYIIGLLVRREVGCIRKRQMQT